MRKLLFLLMFNLCFIYSQDQTNTSVNGLIVQYNQDFGIGYTYNLFSNSNIRLNVDFNYSNNNDKGERYSLEDWEFVKTGYESDYNYSSKSINFTLSYIQPVFKFNYGLIYLGGAIDYLNRTSESEEKDFYNTQADRVESKTLSDGKYEELGYGILLGYQYSISNRFNVYVETKYRICKSWSENHNKRIQSGLYFYNNKTEKDGSNDGMNGVAIGLIMSL